jgi:radical SAM superfamily enzyme YgiQ (UPF0313 family)
MLIYLADTVHGAGQLNPDTVPYNVARIAAYAQSRHPEHEYRLFKDPHFLLDQLRNRRPDVLALSHYFWNTRLNHRIARYARELYPDILIVTGGPNLDRDRAAYARYSAEHPYVDFVVIEEGETAFTNIITAWSGSADLSKLKSADVAGTFAIVGPGDIRLSTSQPRVRDLNDFPSPYLNGMLTPFLEAGLRPILETVRGCPYRCAFCEQGSEFFTKIAALSEDRVVAEVEYIRSRTTASQLILADVNFGILKRDLDVAKFLKSSHEEHGWPRSLYVYNAKQPTETTLRTMETLYPMAQLCMSFQSTDENVLENIHRANIGYDKYSFITQWAKKRNLPVGTELIYGLPGETRGSFVQGYETLLNFRADYMASYNLRLFPGVELNSPEKRREYDVRTRFRPMDVNLGEYRFSQPERILEIEEIVLSNSTLTEEDFFHVRRLAFMVEVLWNTGYLRPALAFLANHGFKVTEILQDVLIESRNSAAASFFEEYDQLVHDELVDDGNEFDRRATDDRYWHDLANGRGVNLKINLAFAGHLLLFDNPFDEFFFDFLSRRYGERLSAESKAIFDQILSHCRMSKVDLQNPETRRQHLSFDVPEWIRATYPVELAPYELPAPVEYTYALDEDTLAAALRTKRRLEHQGAKLNHIAERIFMEVPPVYRGTRPAIREDIAFDIVPSDALEQRVSWGG